MYVEYFQISWRVYVEYIKCIGVPIFALFVLLSAVSQVSNIGTSLWLAKWSSDGDSDRDTNLAVYAALGLSQGELKVDYTLFWIANTNSVALWLDNTYPIDLYNGMHIAYKNN